MKIYITEYLTSSGGAGRFLNTLKKYLSIDGHTITHDLLEENIDIALINASSETIERVINFKYQNPNAAIIHRLDGLLSREKRISEDNYLAGINNYTDHTIFQSEHCVEVFKGVIEPKSYTVIYNGSEYQKTAPYRGYPKNLKVYHISWATGSWKAIDRFFEFIEFCKNDRRISFYAIGNYLTVEQIVVNKLVLDTPEFYQANKDIFDNYENTYYQGYLLPEQAMSVISNMDYLFFPSRVDSCPNSVIESLCCEVPVIYHNSGGTPELVKDAGIDIDKFSYPDLIENMLLRKKDLKIEASLRKKDLNITLAKDNYVQVFNSSLKNKKIAKEDIRIGWIFCYGLESGSSRVTHNIHTQFQKLGIYSEVLHFNKTFTVDLDIKAEEIIKDIQEKKLNVVFFQKVCWGEALKVALWCKENNIKTIFGIGDISDNSIYEIVDLVITGAPNFKEIIQKKYPKTKKIIYIDDGLETLPEQYKEHTDNIYLNIGWFGNREKIKDIENIRNILDKEDKIITISNTPEATYPMGYGCQDPWETSRLIQILLSEIDVVILPINTLHEKNLVKSANRLTLPMSLGIPVIASEIPSYAHVRSYNRNCFLVSDFEDLESWQKNINILRTPDARRNVGAISRHVVLTRYNLEVIAKEYALNILELFK